MFSTVVEWAVVPLEVCNPFVFLSTINLLVNWGDQVGHGTVMEVWRLAPFHLMWHLKREWNTRSFEDVRDLGVRVARYYVQRFLCLNIYS